MVHESAVKQHTSMRKVGSLASVSTRASSSNSVCDLGSVSNTQTRKGKQHTSMRKVGSLASVSTRASSSNSVCDLGIVSDTQARKGDLTQHKTATPAKAYLSRRLLLKLACAAALAWAWSRFIVRRSKNASRWGPPALGAFAGLILSALKYATGTTGRVGQSPGAAMPNGDAKRQALVAMHPHGQFLIGPLFVFGPGAMKTDSPWNGLYVAAADVVFQVPLFRELVLLVLGRSASMRMIDTLLGRGKTVTIFPGGIHEQLATDPEQERCFFAPKLGFVREAIKHGVPLQPVYVFGENQQMDVPNWARKLSAAIKVPVCVPRFGKRPPLLVQPGRPVEVGPADASPSDERIRDVFRRYCTELLRLFDEHKDAALPAEVAARGLQLVWRGHESEDFLAPEKEATQPVVAELPAAIAESVHSELPLRTSRL